jgi:hypothetical protein
MMPKRAVDRFDPYNVSMARRPTFQRGIKRGRICDWPDGVGTPDEVAARVTYTGNTIHKTYPSPAGPPARRADEAKCDVYDVADWPRLLDALRQAIRARCVGSFRGGFPSRAWVWINGILHEARLTGAGDYHGFPINDPRQYPEPEKRLEDAPRVEIPVNRV